MSFGRISNDGTRIVGFDRVGRPDSTLCVARLSGGHCAPIRGARLPVADNSAALQWSPDDEWILVRLGSGRVELIDPDTLEVVRPAWLEDGAESWQRTAP
jgi:hypothetical protein